VRADLLPWLQACAARLMELPPEDLPVDRSLLDMGVDSLLAVRLAGLMSEAAGVEIDPAAVYDFPTIELLAAHMQDAAMRGRAQQPLENHDD
jgi:acyl carrier protein